MKKMKVLVIIFIVMSLFSCKSVDFKRIHKEVEEIETPSVIQEEPETEEVPSSAGEETDFAPLYENGELVPKDGNGEEEPEEETEVQEETVELSLVPSEEEKPSPDTAEKGEPFPLSRILMGLGALVIVVLIILISVMASRIRSGEKGKEAIPDEDDDEEEKEFHYAFNDREYGLYLSSLDFRVPPSDDEEDGSTDEDVPDDPDTIISILRNE